MSTFAGTEKEMGHVDGPKNLAKFASPRGIVLDFLGNLIVADYGNGCLRKISKDGTVSTLPKGDLNGPDGLTMDLNGDILVTDSMRHCLYRVVGEKEIKLVAGIPGVHGNKDGKALESMFYTPSGVQVDLNGDVYVAESSNNTIRKIRDGMVSTVMVSQKESFSMPSGLVLDRKSGDLFVMDTANYVVRRVSKYGESEVVAGKMKDSGYAEGNPLTSMFGFTVGISMDKTGIYMADRCAQLLATDTRRGNHKIRKLCFRVFWTAQLHHRFPSETRKKVKGVMMMRYKECLLARLPKELLVLILSLAEIDDFET